MFTRTYLFVRHGDTESAINIKNELQERLRETTGADLIELKRKFAVVKDCAKTMPCVFEFSTSQAHIV